MAAAKGARVRVRVRARDVMLALERPAGISALNVMAGVVVAVAEGAGTDALVTVDCGGERLLARVTRRSVAGLGLAPGRAVFAIVKAVTFDRGNTAEARVRAGRRLWWRGAVAGGVLMPSLSLRINLDPGGRIGPGKVELLERIAAEGSISGGARAMGMSYKHAWDLVEEMNGIFGKPVVDGAEGRAEGRGDAADGAGGGGGAAVPGDRGAARRRRRRRMWRRLQAEVGAG